MVTKLIKNQAERKCTCIFCGIEMVKGEERIQAFTPKHKRGQSAHPKCINKLWDVIDDTLFHENNHDSLTCANHKMVVIAPKEEAVYFGECGAEIAKHSPTHRKFIFDVTNRYTTGHIIPTCWEQGYKVLVNGVEVTNWEEFDMVTR